MNRKMVLRLPPKGKRAVYVQIALVLIMFWLRDVLHVPSFITYFTDVLVLYLLMFKLKRIKTGVFKAEVRWQFCIVMSIIFCMLIGTIINFVKPILILWGMRNNLRFFAFFFICIGILDAYDVDSIIQLLRKFFWLNVVMCTYQYFALEISNDYLGGFFGTEQGCNAYINVLLCIVGSIVIGRYLVGKEKLHTLIIYIIALMYLAALSELKIFYVEFVIIVFVAFISTKPSLKTVAICAASVIAIIVGVSLLEKYNPESLRFLLDDSAREVYLAGNGYTNSGDLNRFTAVQQLHSKFFEGDRMLSLFGFGLGSCENSNYSFLQSDFYQQYGELHYRWFTHAWVYLEQGAIGLSLMVLFFISLFVCTVKKIKNVRKDLVLATLVFIPTCLVGIIYNCALEIEACYLIAFMCSMPFVLSKNDSRSKE